MKILLVLTLRAQSVLSNEDRMDEIRQAIAGAILIGMLINCFVNS